MTLKNIYYKIVSGDSMKNKGFTLIEMIAVVMIIALISLVALPTIVNQLGERKNDVSSVTNDLIFQATELYMSNKVNTYSKTIGKTYCVRLEELVNNGSLSKPITDYETGEEISLAKWACVKVNSYKEYDYYKYENSHGVIISDANISS